MGWLRTALKELSRHQAATVEYTGGALRGRIEGGQTITISAIDPSAVVVDDVILVLWKNNPVLRVVMDFQEDRLAVGDTLSPIPLGWVDRVAVLGKVTEVHPLPENFVTKPKPHVTTFGLDTPNDYGHQRVLDALGVRPLNAAEPSVGVSAQVLFMPSFDAECCITVSTNCGTAEIALVTMQTNLWYWWCHQMQEARGNIAPHTQTPSPPSLWQERAVIPQDRFALLEASLNVTETTKAPERKYAILDGMKVHIQWSGVHGSVTSFEAQIEKSQPHYPLTVTIYEIARDLLQDERSAVLLEHLHGYLGIGLPLSVIRSSPLTVRLFGSLSSSDEAALATELAQFPVDVPMIVDMSNFRGMGTMLYPLFQRFSSTRVGPTAWWVNDHAKYQLEGAGVPASAMFKSRDDALRVVHPSS